MGVGWTRRNPTAVWIECMRSARASVGFVRAGEVDGRKVVARLRSLSGSRELVVAILSVKR